MSSKYSDIKNGVVLAELGGYGDGPYCAEHGNGSSLVMLGTYIVDPGDSVPYPKEFVFKPGRENYASYLSKHVTDAKVSGAKIGISVISVELSDTVDFLIAAEVAGADYVSLCALSEMEMFTSAGLGVELCRSENLRSLEKWTSGILEAVTIPFILKFGILYPGDLGEVFSALRTAGVEIAHVNIEDSKAGSEGLRLLPELATSGLFIIAGGKICDIEGAKRVIGSGADAVSIGTAAMGDPGLCGRLNNIMKGK